MTRPGSNPADPFKVLLVEDNPADAELVRLSLEFASDRFYSEVSHFERLEDAILATKQVHFDAVLLDLSLPDSFGFESIERMSDATPDLAIVVLTGNSENQGRSALTRGAQDYLIKGQFDCENLVRALTYSSERQKFSTLARASLNSKNTALIEAQRSLELTSQELKKASQTKSDFLANMSHEIRTPLGAMLGFAQLMQDPLQTANERNDCISTILRNGRQLGRVINEILDLSKIESDKMEIEAIEFSIYELVEGVAALLNLQALEKGLSFKISFGENIPEHLISDPTRLRQILFNIIGNAIKFTSSGCVKVLVQVRPDRPEILEFVVEDTGKGLTDEQRQRLFKPFMQADNSVTREFGGTGLGLLLSKRLAQAMGGDVIITESKLGHGSTFLIQIATGNSQHKTPTYFNRSHVTDSQQNSEPAEVDLSSFNILVVDDSPDNRILIRRFLIAAGATVDCAADGGEGVQKACSSMYDAVLMDIQMPKTDGFAALRALLAKNYHSPIFALTAHAMKGDREKCLAAGFTDHLVKPINRDELLSRLAQVKPRENSISMQ